ncbi:hypothetical protein EVAR_12538_1 [Eumeta japonica]|uniref:Uncharacterized protein n=1 Tax=Eumeta variegata TaxID=151549 RepID=A0A4C1TPR2_EUMVA|nr:hypothetical protein EVAR_12538_1 [Eumeta japonica]
MTRPFGPILGRQNRPTEGSFRKPNREFYCRCYCMSEIVENCRQEARRLVLPPFALMRPRRQKYSDPPKIKTMPVFLLVLLMVGVSSHNLSISNRGTWNISPLYWPNTDRGLIATAVTNMTITPSANGFTCSLKHEAYRCVIAVHVLYNSVHLYQQPHPDALAWGSPLRRHRAVDFITGS